MSVHEGHRQRMRRQLKTSGMDSLSDVQVLEFCSTTPSPAPIPIRLPTGCWSASGLCPAFWKPRRTSF